MPVGKRCDWAERTDRDEQRPGAVPVVGDDLKRRIGRVGFSNESAGSQTRMGRLLKGRVRMVADSWGDLRTSWRTTFVRGALRPGPFGLCGVGQLGLACWLAPGEPQDPPWAPGWRGRDPRICQ